MTWREYVSDYLGGLLLHAIGMIALSIFLLATGTEVGKLIIILIVWTVGLFFVHITKFIRKKSYLQELEAIMKQLEQKHLFAECVPIPKYNYERFLFELMQCSYRSMIGTVSDVQASQKEYREYIESWVHEIKTPITAAQLICRNEDENIRRKLQPELAQIENHVERALFYARSESPERDFVIRKVNLKHIVSQALANHRSLLIQNGVCVEMDDIDVTVYTDEKWTVFLLGQLLQNSARYRKENPKVQLLARMIGQQVQLTVSDNGIGIVGHDLPRIFDRGFTGSNGRSIGSATGMGLYLCRKLANFLQIDLKVHSATGEGTDFVLTFPQKEIFQNCKIT